MLIGINIVLITAISVVLTLYMLRRRTRIVSSQLGLNDPDKES